MRVSEAEARRYVEDVWEDVVADIAYLVAVESVEDKERAAPGAPFGPGPAEALRRALEMAERLGLEVHDCDGYLGYGELRGESDTYLATICHADIVPLGEGWDTDPLDMCRREGYLLGRGVLDDKGPLVLSLWAAHYFVERLSRTHETLPYTLRSLIGTNEETGMADVEHYLAHHAEPAFCFTPDAMFPLICGEKGHFCATVASAVAVADEVTIQEVWGGTATNAVPSKAVAVVCRDTSELPAAEHITCRSYGTDEAGHALSLVMATGIGGHAAMPEGTRNAIKTLVDYLSAIDGLSETERGFLSFQRRLLADTDGSALGLACADEAFGPLTIVGGTVGCTRSAHHITYWQTLDSRYPNCMDGERLRERIKEVAQEARCALVSSTDAQPFYISPDSPEISALMESYHEVKGPQGEPFTIGGGTYARHFERAVAFGPDDLGLEHPGWVGPEHGANEGVREQTLQDALVTYILSIARLMDLDL